MKLIYDVNDKPKFGQLLVFAIQQLLAIMTATLVVPVIINGACDTTMSSAAALFGAGIGTLVYLAFTKFKSPVFLGSSFAFIGLEMNRCLFIISRHSFSVRGVLSANFLNNALPTVSRLLTILTFIAWAFMHLVSLQSM